MLKHECNMTGIIWTCVREVSLLRAKPQLALLLQLPLVLRTSCWLVTVIPPHGAVLVAGRIVAWRHHVTGIFVVWWVAGRSGNRNGQESRDDKLNQISINLKKKNLIYWMHYLPASCWYDWLVLQWEPWMDNCWTYICWYSHVADRILDWRTNLLLSDYEIELGWFLEKS